MVFQDNWRNFILSLFSIDLRYKEIDISETKDVAGVVYSTKITFIPSYNPQTKIVFHIYEERLMLYEITNIHLRILNKYFESIRCLEEGHYEDPPEFGECGLLFNSRNRDALAKDLRMGFQGRECHYLHNGTFLAAHIAFERGSIAGVENYTQWDFCWKPSGLGQLIDWLLNFANPTKRAAIFLEQSKFSDIQKFELADVYKGIEGSENSG